MDPSEGSNNDGQGHAHRYGRYRRVVIEARQQVTQARKHQSENRGDAYIDPKEIAG